MSHNTGMNYKINGENVNNSKNFLELVLDSITEHIVVINEAGKIQFYNKSWSSFGEQNECGIIHDWKEVNYIEECNKAASMGDESGVKASEGIRKVINKELDIFYFEYPCHSPEEERWFMMRITPFQAYGNNYFVISHQNITERKQAEEKVKHLAKIDGLTGIPNRRAFDEFLISEMKRCARLKKPICLAIIDIDNFKILNDTYGHQSGDKCLIEVGKLLKSFAQRPGDICARYGGEEFALIWGGTPLTEARKLSETLLQDIANLNIENTKSPTQPYLTVSIGLAEIIPDQNSREDELISKADSLLYRAKNSGKNRVEC